MTNNDFLDRLGLALCVSFRVLPFTEALRATATELAPRGTAERNKQLGRRAP